MRLLANSSRKGRKDAKHAKVKKEEEFTTEGNSELHGGHGVEEKPLVLFSNPCYFNHMIAQTKPSQSPTQKMPKAFFVLDPGNRAIIHLL